MDVLELRRQKADATKSDCGDKNAIVNDLQTFLSLAFMLLIPVDRSRTYYELELGKTFVYGIYSGGRFTPASLMQDPSTATWYIHLMPDDHKTGFLGREYWTIMPNVQFSDGQKLYEYIERWLQIGREYEHQCDHNFFFRQIRTYKALNSGDWNRRIRHVFEIETGIPVTPNELRKMYITYLNNQQVSNAELSALSAAMQQGINLITVQLTREGEADSLCVSCKYFNGSSKLGCAVHPTTVCTESASNCPDFSQM